MTITYSLAAQDWVESQTRRLRRKLAGATARRTEEEGFARYASSASLFLIFAGGAMLFTGALHLGLHVSPFFLAFACVVGSLWVFFAFMLLKAFNPASVVKAFNKDERNAGPFSLELTETGIVYVAPGWTVEMEWRAVRSVFETTNLILISDDQPRSYLVPKRAFLTLAQQDEFKATVANRLTVKP